MNPFRYGPGTTYNSETNNLNWFGDSRNGGRGAYTLDSSQLFTVVTQFHSPTANALSNITRFYLQNGYRIDLPPLYVLPVSSNYFVCAMLLCFLHHLLVVSPKADRWLAHAPSAAPFHYRDVLRSHL